LIAGKNNVGKSTVLEAIFFSNSYAQSDTFLKLNMIRGAQASTVTELWKSYFNLASTEKKMCIKKVEEISTKTVTVSLENGKKADKQVGEILPVNDTLKLSNNNVLDQYLSISATDGTEEDNIAFYIGFDGKLQTEDLNQQNNQVRNSTFTQYLSTRIGYGGSSLPNDTMQLEADFKDIPECLISSISKSNHIRKDFIANDIYEIGKKNVPFGEPTIGVYRLLMKKNSDNFNLSSTKSVIKRLSKMGLRVVIYEPNLYTDSFEGYEVIASLDEFLTITDVIIANRYDQCLDDVSEKVYTRDIFNRD
jgi:hypothetical protein